MVSNFTRSLVVFMPNITTNNAITYTNSLFAVNDTDRNKCKPNEKLFGLLGSSSLHVNSPLLTGYRTSITANNSPVQAPVVQKVD